MEKMYLQFFHQKVQKGKLVVWLKDEEKEAVCDKKS